MDASERRLRARDVLASCLEGDEAQWPLAVELACARSPELADDLRSMFAALGASGLMAPAPIRRIADFELLEPLGGGGMGDVFRARDTRDGSEVAVKLVRSEVRLLPESIERFEREMRTIAALQHPNIVRLRSAGVVDGVPYCAMELVHGLSIDEVVRRLQGREPGSLRGVDLARVLDGDPRDFPGGWVETCFRILARAARALAHAHDHAVVHRDLKPANVMLTRRGEPVLIDFGLAKPLRDVRLTRSGARLGSLPYLAPELWRRPLAHDTRSEVYSLGLVLWELLALQSAFRADGEEELRTAILAGSARSLRALQPALSKDAEVVCACAIDVEPSRRYADCEQFADDLDSVLALRPISARARGRISRAWLLARRRPFVSVLTAASVAVVALLFVLGTVHAAAADAEHDFAMRDRSTQAAWAIDALTFLNDTGHGTTWPLGPATKASHEFWVHQAREVLAYLEAAKSRGDAEAGRFVRPLPGLQPAESGARWFVPRDDAEDRDHSAHLTERSVTIAIRTLQNGIRHSSNMIAIADVFGPLSIGSPEARADWAEAQRLVVASGLYPGLQLQPQLGLRPVGADPSTGRLLLWHVGTGTRPDPRRTTPTADPVEGILMELVPASPEVPRPFLLALRPMPAALWHRIGFGVPPHRYEDPTPVTNVSLNDCRMVLPRIGLRLPTPAEWHARYGAAERPAGILEWTADGTAPNDRVRLAPESDSVSQAKTAALDLAVVTLAEDAIGVRAACDLERVAPPAPPEVERVYASSSFRDWTCGTTGAPGSGAAWILRDDDGNPGECLETVTFSGHAWVLCLHPDAIWDPGRDGVWTHVDLAVDCSNRTNHGFGETVMPVVQQGDRIFFGHDRRRVSGRIRAWHTVGVHAFTPVDFVQIVPRDWAEDPTYLYRGPATGPDLSPGAPPMRFGFGVYARMSGVYRQRFDNFRLTVRRQR